MGEEVNHKVPTTVVYCVRDDQGKVTYQNTLCQNRCGDMAGIVCSGGCTEHLKAVTQGKPRMGIKVAANVTLGDDQFDIALVTTEGQCITIALPIEKEIDARKSELLSYGLTEREIEVANLVVEGQSNRQISKRLHIAHSTVKKHLYSIYGKIPKSKLVRR